MEIKELQARFKKVEILLKAKPWFTKEKWVATNHPFPHENPDGVTFHVYKKHWFNEEHLGIHFESYLDSDPKKQKKTYVTLHTLHYQEIPATKKSRKSFSQPLVNLIFAEISSWDGYTFRTGKYGLQPFTKFLDASKPDFEKNLALEIERLCRFVGPKVDQVLRIL